MLIFKRKVLTSAIAATLCSSLMAPATQAKFLAPEEGSYNLTLSENIFSTDNSESGAASVYQVESNENNRPLYIEQFNLINNAEINAEQHPDIAALSVVSSFSGNITNNGRISGAKGVQYYAQQYGTLINEADGTILGTLVAVSVENAYNPDETDFDGYFDELNNKGLIASATGYAIKAALLPTDRGEPDHNNGLNENGIAVNNAASGSIIGKLQGSLHLTNSGIVKTSQGLADDAIASYLGLSGSSLYLNINQETDNTRAILKATEITLESNTKLIVVPTKNLYDLIDTSGKTYIALESTDTLEVEDENFKAVFNNAILAKTHTIATEIKPGLKQVVFSLARKPSTEPVNPKPPTEPVDPKPPTEPVDPKPPTEPIDPKPPTEPVDPKPPTEPEPPVTPPTETMMEILQSAGFARPEARFLVKFLVDGKNSDDPIIALFNKALKMEGDQTADDAIAEAKKLYALFNKDDANISRAGIESTLNAAQKLIDARNASVLGIGTGDIKPVRGLWLQGLYDRARQKTRSNINGYHARTKGFTLGFDREFAAGLSAGVAISHGISDINSRTGDGTTKSKSYLATLYGTRQLGRLLLEGSVFYGQAKNNSQLINKTGKARYNSATHGVRLLASVDFHFGEQGILLQPVAGVNYNRVTVDSYSYKGSVTLAPRKGLKVDTLELGLGARANATLEVENGVLVPNIRAMYWHNTRSDTIEQQSRFAIQNTPDTVSYASTAKNTYQLGIGLQYLMDNDLSLAVNYDRNHKSGYSSGTYTAELRYDF